MATENCLKQDQKLGDASLESNTLSSEEYAKLACHGIDLMLNNDFAAAEKLFCQHKDQSCHMAVGYCYLTFMNAVMSFEEEQIQHCRDCLRETEKKYRHGNSNATTPCSASSPAGQEASWYSSVKNLLSGSYDKHSEDPVWQLERHVVLADCQVLLALLNFLQQELGSVMRGGWVLRRAWKMYDTTYSRLVAMYNAAVAAATSPSTHTSHAASALGALPRLQDPLLPCCSGCWGRLASGTGASSSWAPCCPPRCSSLSRCWAGCRGTGAWLCRPSCARAPRTTCALLWQR